jgi:hypothetical protein
MMIVTTALLGALLAPSPAPPGPRAEALAPATVSAAAQAEPIARTSVGMRVRIEEQPIPGPRLQAKPVADPGRADAIVRVLNVFPHGSGWRYNLEVTPLVEGTLDLGALLEPAEAGATWDAPVLEIEVEALLPEDVVEPNDLDVPAPDEVGGYGTGMTILGILWAAGLVALVTVGRRGGGAAESARPEAPLTLADRLAPLVDRARSGELDASQQAELERLLLAHWRERRNLSATPVAEAVASLRADEDAGPLFLQLERWLHRPGSEGDAVDLEALLAPYRGTPDPGGDQG